MTGGSVVGLKYNGGVMIGADMLASYGATKRYKSIERVRRATDNAVVGATGEVGDFNYVCRLVEQMDTDDFVEDDGAKTQPRALHSFLQRVQYNRRTRLDPLWQSLVVAGVGEDMKPFLGCIGMIGQSYEDDHVATGFGAHMARPLLREKHSPSMAKDDAEVLLCDCLRVLFYRDKNTINKFQIATVDSRSGVSVSDPFALSTTWSFSRFHNPAELLQVILLFLSLHASRLRPFTSSLSLPSLVCRARGDSFSEKNAFFLALRD